MSKQSEMGYVNLTSHSNLSARQAACRIKPFRIENLVGNMQNLQLNCVACSKGCIVHRYE